MPKQYLEARHGQIGLMNYKPKTEKNSRKARIKAALAEYFNNQPKHARRRNLVTREFLPSGTFDLAGNDDAKQNR